VYISAARNPSEFGGGVEGAVLTQRTGPRKRFARQVVSTPQRTGSFEIGTNDLDNVLSSFFRGLGFARHVIANMVFHELSHKAVDGTTGGGETLKNLRAARVLFEGTLDSFELSDDLLAAINEIQFFTRIV